MGDIFPGHTTIPTTIFMQKEANLCKAKISVIFVSLQATTDLYGKCTTRHSGTSAAAPEAAGVFALALEAK